MRYSPLLLCFFILCLATPAAGDSKIKEHELRDVRARIAALKSDLGAKTRQRKRLDKAIAESEADLKLARKRLNETQSQLVGKQSQLDQLQLDIGVQTTRLGQETRQLGGQLRRAYMNGRAERAQLLLNQQSPAELGRTLAYYGFMNKARQRNIDAVGQTLKTLGELHTDATASKRLLVELKASREQHLAATSKQLEQRAGLLAKLDRDIAETGGTVAELKRREADLERLILELSSILGDYPITSEAAFAELKGKLTWPVNGRLIHDFGQPRDGGALKWNGVMLATERGREVRALYHGRVAFADRLSGLGFLLVLDHGDGYMSLYGHNDELLKTVGDWVGAGDAIATVGDSGGQDQSALYLEIRSGKKPLNPSRWISKRPRK